MTEVKNIILSFRDFVVTAKYFKALMEGAHSTGPISPRNAALPHDCHPHLMTEVKNIILSFRDFVVTAQYFKALMEGAHSTTVGRGCRPNVLEKFWPSLTHHSHIEWKGLIPPTPRSPQCTCPASFIYNTMDSNCTKCGGRRVVAVLPRKASVRCPNSVLM